MGNPLQVENLKGAISLGTEALKSLILINGAAAIALLTFCANTARLPDNKVALYASLISFAVGVGLSMSAFIAAYLAQLDVATTGGGKREVTVRWWAIGFGIAATVAFFVGVGTAALALI